MNKTVEICEMAMIINRESGLSLEISATIAEALYNEGCRKLPNRDVDFIKRGFWEPLGNLFYKCTTCGCFSNDVAVYCPYCGSKNCLTYTAAVSLTQEYQPPHSTYNKGDNYGRKQN